MGEAECGLMFSFDPGTVFRNVGVNFLHKQLL